MSKESLKGIIDALQKFWDQDNTRSFRRCMFMHRNELTSMDPDFIDACELIMGCDDYVLTHTVMGTLLDFAAQYADDVESAPTNLRCSVSFGMQMIRDLG